MQNYDHQSIESKWRAYWKEQKINEVVEDTTKPKFYVLDMFPYPSGAGLHVGHPLGYIASDIFSRYKRLRGFNVLHPMGFDAFGLPTEQYAIQTGIHPAVSTDKNIKRYREQMDQLALSYDWSREVRTCDPDYYKWTQWIFTQLFDHYYDLAEDKALPISRLKERFEAEGNLKIQAAHTHANTFDAATWRSMTAKEQAEVIMDYRLAYRKIGYVNWCEALGTVLANDQIKDGLSERGAHPVEKRAMTQWYLRITAYAERLLAGLDQIDWSDALKTMQRNWLGRSEGASIQFDIKDHDAQLEIYTTRPDTIFGATFMVLAPEHPLVSQITTSDQQGDIDDYLQYVKSRSERDRQSDVKNVTGAFTGAYALNPFTQVKIPIWIAEYVLMDYGTGAIMAVPAGDERDHKFATKFNLPIIEIIDRTDYPNAGIEDKVGTMINSDFINGKPVREAIAAVCQAVEDQNLGRRQVNFKMRDANFSRQRYWGEPFPIVYNDEDIATALPLSELPLTLPDSDDFQPTAEGASPLARVREWVELPDGRRRETDTMPAVAGSSWYYLRYMDPGNNEAFASKSSIDYWQDVDLYIGGAEHAVSHLMYARFWHKFLYDLGYLPSEEPFQKLINQGMIQGVIEFLYLKKEKTEGQYHFICRSMASDFEEEDLVRIPVPIEYVSAYGTDESYLTTEGIDGFIKWSPSYKDAIFEIPDGTYQKGATSTTGDQKEFQLITHSEVGKMSKSKYNVINPDDVIGQYGTDCFRMYEMFLGPLESSKPWDTNGIDGVFKFIRRLWRLFFDEEGAFVVDRDTPPSKDELRILHSTIKKVQEDIERYSFNTCVSHFMIAVNDLKAYKVQKQEIAEALVVLISPFAPHIAEELWHQLGHKDSVHRAKFPKLNEEYLKQSEITYPVSINGKKRTEAAFSVDATKEDIEAQAIKLDAVQKWIDGKTIRKVIIVPGRMINIVAN